MCGIVGYVGQREAAPIVMDGLRKLEYRGYDSAGVAVVNGGDIQLRRSAGKLEKLERIIALEPMVGTTGIGHTRWATHGKPSEANAHPHVDCKRRAVVIHNGIVENYLELKLRLRENGHKFASETDTEVIVHLIEEEVQAGYDLEEATRRALQQIKGAHAIVVLSADEPDRLVVARLGNAGGVVVGYGENEMFVASDLPAILEHTRRVVFLDNQEMAVVTRDGAHVRRLTGEVVEKTIQTVNLDPVAAAKGGYKHFMLKEIYEQPRAIQDTVRSRLRFSPPGVAFEDFLMTAEMVRDLERIIITACGSAFYAGLVGKFLIEELARIPVEVDYASEFRYRRPVVDGRTLLLAVTQSGETVDTLVSMEEGKCLGMRVAGIINVLGSQASRVADDVIYTHAGPEIGVASTKAFTCQLAALYLLAIHLGQLRGTISDDDATRYLQDLSEVPHLMGELLERDYDYERLATLFHRVDDFLYLGRGINYPIALEGALKLKEISYIHAEGYPAGEMKHGPISLIENDMPVVAIATRDKVYPKMMNNIEEVKARDGIVIAVATDGDQEIAEKADHVLYVPYTPELLAPIVNVVPLQLLAYHIAERRGCDIDQPRNLAKSVTVE